MICDTPVDEPASESFTQHIFDALSEHKLDDVKVATSEHTIMYTVVVSDHIEKVTETLAEFLAPMIGVEKAESPADTCPTKVVEVTR